MSAKSGHSAVTEVMNGAGPVSAVATELKELEAAMADPERADEMDAIIERYGEVQHRYEELDGYALEGRAVRGRRSVSSQEGRQNETALAVGAASRAVFLLNHQGKRIAPIENEASVSFTIGVRVCLSVRFVSA